MAEPYYRSCDWCAGWRTGPNARCESCKKVTAAGRGSGKSAHSATWTAATTATSFSAGEMMSVFSEDALARRDAKMIKAGLDEAAAVIEKQIVILQESLSRTPPRSMTAQRVRARLEILKKAKEAILNSGSAAVDRYYREHEAEK